MNMDQSQKLIKKIKELIDINDMPFMAKKKLQSAMDIIMDRAIVTEMNGPSKSTYGPFNSTYCDSF